MKTKHYLIAANLVAQFYQALDSNQYERISSLFAEEGAWHRGAVSFQGVDAIQQLLAERDPARLTCHQISNLVIQEQGDRLNISYYLTVYVNPSPALNPTVILLMNDELIYEQGRWCILHKRSKPHLKALV